MKKLELENLKMEAVEQERQRQAEDQRLSLQIVQAQGI